MQRLPGELDLPGTVLGRWDHLYKQRALKKVLTLEVAVGPEHLANLIVRHLDAERDGVGQP